MTPRQVLRQPRLWAPLLVLLLGATLAILTAHALQRSEREQRDLQLSNIADGFSALLQMHLAGCEASLRAAAHMASSMAATTTITTTTLDGPAWQRIGRQVRVGEFESCAESLFYLPGHAAAQVPAALWTAPPPTLRDAADALLRDPAQRAAMDAAREAGEPRLSAPVRQPGADPASTTVFWYMPVFRRDTEPTSPEERAAALTGYVGVPIRVQAVVEVLSRQVPNAELALVCHANARAMYGLDSDGTAQGATAAAGTTRERTLRIGGRWWTLHARLPAQDPTVEGLHASTISLATGLLLSLSLAWLTWFILTQSARAHALARRYSRDASDMAQQARETAALNQAIMDATPIGILTIDAQWHVTTANQAAHAMLGYAPGELVGQHARVLSDPEEVALRAARLSLERGVTVQPGPELFHSHVGPNGQLAEMEWTQVRKDGSRFPGAVIALPLSDAAGRSLGGLRLVMDITERKRAAAHIEHLALHDSLTGLANRLQLQERAGHTLLQAQRNNKGFALALIDLDRFKQINDTLGHGVGDEVLKALAQRLRYAVRASDTVVRMGGDEFALLLPDIQAAEEALNVARHVLAAMTPELQVESQRLHLTVSIGVAVFPDHGTDLGTLLRNADTAMYDAKDRGRDAVSLYDPSMSERSSHQLALQADLRQALARGEFLLHYQPLVDAVSGEVRALEALLRWQHPRRGLVPPNEFIPLAEETGLIVPIGAWALRQAAADLARLRQAGRPQLRMAINLSPRQFAADGLETSVAEALQAAGLEGSALELEITESLLMNSVERTQRILGALRAMGVHLAIDDFGTGYSSLSYLAHFPVQTLKVDRSFVRQIDSGGGTALLAGAIVAIAHSLGLTVVAEGVETSEQHEHLMALGCELLQGFLFSRPVAFDQLPSTLARVEAMAAPPASAHPVAPPSPAQPNALPLGTT